MYSKLIQDSDLEKPTVKVVMQAYCTTDTAKRQAAAAADIVPKTGPWSD